MPRSPFTSRMSTGGLACARKIIPDLPGEILLIIFSFMQYANFWHARLVSKIWKTSWDTYWDKVTTQYFRQQLPLWLFECKLQIPPCGRFMRFVHAYRYACEQDWTVTTWILVLRERLHMLDVWNNRLITRVMPHYLNQPRSNKISLQGHVHIRMLCSQRTSEKVPWLKFYEENCGLNVNAFTLSYYKLCNHEKRRIEVLNEEQMPWFYNDAIPPIALLAKAKPFPSLYPKSNHLKMPSWIWNWRREWRRHGLATA